MKWVCVEIVFGCQESTRRCKENLRFLFLFFIFKTVKLKLKLFFIKIGGKCQRGILKYLLNIIFINLFVMSVSNVPTIHTVSYIYIFRY